jgi:phospholipase/lecithinase/hemolysin
MQSLSFKAALTAALILIFAPLEAAFGWGQLRIVAFGDSLLDAGTYAPFASKAPFNGGRYTTNPGQNFTQVIAKHYGDTLTPAFVGGFGSKPCLAANGGLDYAQGGSRVSMQPGRNYAPNCAQATTLPVKDQVSLYLSAYGKFNSNQLVLINGGANDVLFQLDLAERIGTPQALLAALQAIAHSAADLAKIVETVVAKGAAHVVVFNLPDIGKTPAGVFSKDHGKLLTEVSKLFNATLAFALQLQHRNLSGKVILIDAFGFVDSLVANLKTYGFSVSNTGIACNLAAQVNEALKLCDPKKNPRSLYCTNPSLFLSSLFCSPNTYTAQDADRTFIFADEVHPTTHANALFAFYVEQQIAAKIW